MRGGKWQAGKQSKGGAPGSGAATGAGVIATVSGPVSGTASTRWL